MVKLPACSIVPQYLYRLEQMQVPSSGQNSGMGGRFGIAFL